MESRPISNEQYPNTPSQSEPIPVRERRSLTRIITRLLIDTAKLSAQSVVRSRYRTLTTMKIVVLHCVVTPIAAIFWMITIPCLLGKTLIDYGLLPRQKRFLQAEGIDNSQPCDTAHKITCNVHGNAVNGLLFETTVQAPCGVQIIFHPNAVTATSYSEIQQDLINRLTASGYHCLIAEYPGYSDSYGSVCSEHDFQESADAFYRLAKSRFPECGITLYGISIGTWAVAYLAGKYPQAIERAVLCAPFANITDLIAHHGRHFFAELGCRVCACCIYCMVKLFSLYKVNNADSLANYVRSNPNAEIVITHSYGDSIIPYQHSMNICTACNRAKQTFFHNQKIRCISLAHEYDHCYVPHELEQALFSSDVFDLDFEWLKEPPAEASSDDEDDGALSYY